MSTKNLQILDSLITSPVGDILTTVRTDLGEKWLLCNGEQVRVGDYSELGKLFSRSVGVEYETFKVEGFTTIYCITYANGYWVIGGYYKGDSNSRARIAYTTDLASDWTIKDLWTNVYYTFDAVKCITYANGYWVVGGENYSFSGRIAYTTDLASDWTIKNLWSGSYSVNGIIYANGYWAVCGTSGKFAYTTDLAGTWTTKTLTFSLIECITYANGYWVVGGYDSSGSSYYARIAYTTDLAGTWTTKDLWHYTDFCFINCITYADGYWVVGGRYDSSTNYARIAYTTDLTGTWTTKDLWYSSNVNEISCITYADGYWVVGGRYDSSYASIAYTTDLTGTWVTTNLWRNEVYCIAYEDGKWAVGGASSGSLNAAYGNLYRYFKLPTISTSGAYTYIKALEG